MPFVLISHHPDDHKLPRDIIPKLVEIMPQAVCSAFDMCMQVQRPEDVRIDTKPFSPYAKNQPRVSIQVSLKDKPNRGESFADAVADFITLSVSELLAEHAPGFDPSNVHVTVDLVTRRTRKAFVPEPQ